MSFSYTNQSKSDSSTIASRAIAHFADAEMWDETEGSLTSTLSGRSLSQPEARMSPQQLDSHDESPSALTNLPSPNVPLVPTLPRTPSTHETTSASTLRTPTRATSHQQVGAAAAAEPETPLTPQSQGR